MRDVTNVYHIVQFQSGDAYAFFHGCHWKCSYCVRTLGLWDLGLPEDVRNELDKLWLQGRVKFLSIEEVVAILKESGVRLAFFGGGEPTIDRELKPLIKRLKEEGIDVWLITNGELLDEELVGMVRGITFSIKALDDGLHRRITGRSNRTVLENFKRFVGSGKVVAETVYVKGLVECDEVLRIARFIASLNPETTFRIDPLVQNPPYEEVDSCIKEVMKILPRTYRIMATKGEPPNLLYPRIG
ncbi:radical SAM protein [Thermococcus eurythermalis]|uniref:radical SAM protein n=1 Tax=Thermococcus eurythermalis TaxID=1505907 RepID=UPI001D10134F|nr:radical SAM protein [Thermococcus eurythermalis]